MAKNERAVRQILHDLSAYDNGDDLILIRTGGGKGFYRTDDKTAIEAFRRECLNKGKSIFAPVKKINRVLSIDGAQLDIENNLRSVREAKGMTQAEVCRELQIYSCYIDKSLLSKMENSVCLPMPGQLATLAMIYGVSPDELITYGYTV